MTLDQATVRILDASLNRASEGLRVCEDFVRFAWEDAHLCRQLKALRHDLSEVAAAIPLSSRAAARNTPGDVGASVTLASESHRDDPWAVCQASFERTKQALRSLEEFGKLWSPAWAASVEALRYRLYAVDAAIARTEHARKRLAQTRLCVLMPGGKTNEEAARLGRLLLAAGVDMLQLRDKHLSANELAQRARALAVVVREKSRTEACAPLFIVNDRSDIAAAVNADGVHLGQEDLSVADARGVVGPHRLIGVSTHNLSQARQAVIDGANYLGAGPVFPSSTKTFERFAGIAYLRELAAETALPALAIGGVTTDNVGEVVATGIHRVAVSHAVVGSDDPAGAARELAARLAAAAPLKRSS